MTLIPRIISLLLYSEHTTKLVRTIFETVVCMLGFTHVFKSRRTEDCKSSIFVCHILLLSPLWTYLENNHDAPVVTWKKQLEEIVFKTKVYKLIFFGECVEEP